MARATSGGGINMNKVGHYADPKQEPKPHPVSVGAVSRLGAKVSEDTPHKPLYYNKVSASTPQGPTSGMDCRPGGNGREIMKAGSQSSTPSPHPMGRGRSLFK
jgi:hypothetical protein